MEQIVSGGSKSGVFCHRTSHQNVFFSFWDMASVEPIIHELKLLFAVHSGVGRIQHIDMFKYGNCCITRGGSIFDVYIPNQNIASLSIHDRTFLWFSKNMARVDVIHGEDINDVRRMDQLNRLRSFAEMEVYGGNWRSYMYHGHWMAMFNAYEATNLEHLSRFRKSFRRYLVMVMKRLTRERMVVPVKHIVDYLL
jgi:hypothetical protein